MLDEICGYLKNYFDYAEFYGTYKISDGEVFLPFLSGGQYFRIVGSVFNDGVHRYPSALVDETFTGTVYAMSLPMAFLELVKDIEAWQKKNGDSSPYTSESFAGYSYTKNAESSTWQGAFKSRLARWRKI